jgi:hypothetical protein
MVGTFVGSPGRCRGHSVDIAAHCARAAAGGRRRRVVWVGVVQQVVEVGLTSGQAARLLAANGPNRLPAQRPTPWWRRLAAEMVHFFALLFWVAGGLGFVAVCPSWAWRSLGLSC